MHRLFLILFFFSVTTGSATAQSVSPTGVFTSFDHDGSERSYRIHVPDEVTESSAEVPIVFCLHGGGSDAKMMSKAGWTGMADRQKFIVVYPEGLNGHWNDGRNVRKHVAQNAVTDDVDFLVQLLDHLLATRPIDPSRVYALGLSNGGFMTQRLAVEHTNRFAAVAIQIASLPDTYLKGPLEFRPQAPLSVLFLNGTEDPFMPYEGGKLTPNLAPQLVDSASFDFGQGSSISTVEAARLWVLHNQLEETAEVTELPDKDPDDGCRVKSHLWKNEGNPVSVHLYKVIGGGHTIPGGAQYLPERIIGKVCHDVDGIELTWKFFQSKRRQ